MALEHGATLVLLAHHRRDQAETFLLQALRGAGVAGLAGMPRAVERDGVTWARPWLDAAARRRSRRTARAIGSRFVDDDSNDDAALRAQPPAPRGLAGADAAFPEAEAALATRGRLGRRRRAMRWPSWPRSTSPRAPARRRCDLAAWRRCRAARRSNALRAWLAACAGGPSGDAWSQRLLGEADGVRHARAGRWRRRAAPLSRPTALRRAARRRPSRPQRRHGRARPGAAGVHRAAGLGWGARGRPGREQAASRRRGWRRSRARAPRRRAASRPARAGRRAA